MLEAKNRQVISTNLIRLRKLLDDKGIKPALYDLQSDRDFGVYRITETPDKGYWEVYFYERGRRSGEIRFYDEAEAICYFTEKLAGIQKKIDDAEMRMKKRSPEAQLFLELYLAVGYSVSEAIQEEQKTGGIDAEISVIIRAPSSKSNRIVEITKSLSWKKHISNSKKPSELEGTDKRILARKLMIALERSERLPIEVEEIAEVAKQIDDIKLLEEANKLLDEL